MVHIDSAKKGFATFLDDELMPLVDTPLKKMGAGIALSLILNKFNNLADSLKSVWIIDMAGLFDGDMVDIDSLKEAVCDNLGENGITLPLPIVGDVKIKKADVHKLYQMIKHYEEDWDK